MDFKFFLKITKIALILLSGSSGSPLYLNSWWDLVNLVAYQIGNTHQKL